VCLAGAVAALALDIGVALVRRAFPPPVIGRVAPRAHAVAALAELLRVAAVLERKPRFRVLRELPFALLAHVAVSAHGELLDPLIVAEESERVGGRVIEEGPLHEHRLLVRAAGAQHAGEEHETGPRAQRMLT
jgi:hypothetical protein